VRKAHTIRPHSIQQGRGGEEMGEGAFGFAQHDGKCHST